MGKPPPVIEQAFPGTVDVTTPPSRRRRVEPYRRRESAPRAEDQSNPEGATRDGSSEGADTRTIARPAARAAEPFRSLVGLRSELRSTARYWPVRTRTSWAVDWHTGEGALPGGAAVAVPAQAGLTELLRAWPPQCRRAFVCGPPPAATVAGVRQWAAAELPEGWSLDPKRPHHLATARGFMLHLRCPGGEPVSMLRAAAWFGEGSYRPEDVMAALRWLLGAVRHLWGHDAGLFDTPATTGRDLWARMLPSEGYPVLPEEVRQLIARNAGQGRIEGWWERGTAMPAELESVEVWDGVLMYAALCSELGVGPVAIHDQAPELAPPELGGLYATAWYGVRFTVPDTWGPEAPADIIGGPHDQLGLLPVRTADGWRYPNRGSHTAWVTGAELRLAAACYGGGALSITERLVLSRDRTRSKGPLHAWAQRLLQLGELAAEEGGPLTPAQQRLAHRAARGLVIFALGAFAQRTRERTVMAEDTVPGLDDWTVTANGYMWTETEAGAWAAMAHPEWPATVWGRCRARMLSHKGTGALHADPADVVALYVDALYLRGHREWESVSMPGRLRLKDTIAGPVPAPTSWGALWDL